MFAVLETGSKQYKIAEGDILEVELIDPEAVKKSAITFESVLLISDDKGIHVGDPYVKHGVVKAKLLEELKGPKIVMLKKRPKKTYRKTLGHRQRLHRIQIEKIQIKAPAKKKENE